MKILKKHFMNIKKIINKFIDKIKYLSFLKVYHHVFKKIKKLI